MKKICIAIHALSHAGAERVAVSWANYLACHGHEVFVLTYGRSDDSYALDERVRTIPVAETQAAFFALPIWKRLWAIRRIIHQEAPQTLISFLPRMQINMMLATLGMKMERIETVRNNPWVDKDIGKRRFLWNMCFCRADKIIVQTGEQRSYFKPSLQRKCTVISNPISEEFASMEKRYSHRVRKFVAVGRLGAQKNYPLMIQAFSRAAADLPDCTLEIYGQGTPEAAESIKALICQLGMEKRIRLRGWVRNISQILSKYDAFLMSSDYEGMPNALAEAMATGLVCVSTNCRTGPKDMIEQGCSGYLASVGDNDAFTEVIKTVLEMEVHECADMGSAARARILDLCSEENTLARFIALVESRTTSKGC